MPHFMFDNEDILNNNDFGFCKYSSETELVNSSQYTGTAKFLIFWGVIQFGAFFGFLLTAWIYNKGAHLRDTIDEIFTPEDIPYEKKYKVKYVDGCNKIPSENSYMFENTPDGMVYMNYCQKDEGFGYWADKNIRFSYLEAAARKFVTQFGCSQLYIERECNKEDDIDIRDEGESESEGDVMNDNIEQCKDTTDQEKPETEEKSSDVDSKENDEGQDEEKEQPKSSGPFAQLKKYNTNSNTKSSNAKQNKPTVESNSCKFIKKGKLVDLNFSQETEFQQPNQKMTFESFKAMFG